jgi:peptidoglycan/xylan/chitin deacetylase (PgdA/CDA1 family)
LFSRLDPTQTLIEDPISGERWSPANPAEKRNAFSRCNDHCAKLTGDSMRHYLDELAERFQIQYRNESAGSLGMMTFEQARELRHRGHLIGNHTFSHGNLAHIPPELLHDEIVIAHQILEQELGEPVEHFSYPHPCLEPQWNTATLAETEKLCYKTAVLTSFGTVTQQSPPLQLPRLMLGNQNAQEFRWKIETAFLGLNT